MRFLLCARVLSKMPILYAVDFCWRIVRLYTAKQLSLVEISRMVYVSESTVKRYITQFEQTSDVQPVSQRHGPLKLLRDFEQLVLLRLVLESPAIYLHELQAKLLARFGVTVGIATICRTLKFMGCARQVIQHIPVQQSKELTKLWDFCVWSIYAIVWVGESGCDQGHISESGATAWEGCHQGIIGSLLEARGIQPSLWCPWKGYTMFTWLKAVWTVRNSSRQLSYPFCNHDQHSFCREIGQCVNPSRLRSNWRLKTEVVG